MRSRGIRGVPPRRSSLRSSRRACTRRRMIRPRRSAARGQPRPTRTALPARRAEARSRARGTAVPPAGSPAAMDAASRPRSALMLTNPTSRRQTRSRRRQRREATRPAGLRPASGAALSEYRHQGSGVSIYVLSPSHDQPRAPSKITTAGSDPRSLCGISAVDNPRGVGRAPLAAGDRRVRRSRREVPAGGVVGDRRPRGWLARANPEAGGWLSRTAAPAPA